MLVPVKCPTCNHQIQLDDSQDFGFCMYCGTKLLKGFNGPVADSNNKESLPDVLDHARCELELAHDESALLLLDEALRLNPDCSDAQLMKAFIMNANEKPQTLGPTYGIFTAKDFDNHPKCLFVAGSGAGGVKLTIPDVGFETTLVSGIPIRLPVLKGQQRIVLRDQTYNTVFLTRTDIRRTFVVRPPILFMSGILRVEPAVSLFTWIRHHFMNYFNLYIAPVAACPETALTSPA